MYKRVTTITSIALAGLALPALAGTEHLAASLPPDTTAAHDWEASPAMYPVHRAFLSPSSAEEVLEHYRENYGEPERVTFDFARKNEREPDPEGSSYWLATHEIEQGIRAERGMMRTPPSTLGVRIDIENDMDRANLGRVGCGHRVRQKLQRGMMGRDDIDQSDLEAVCERFSHQARSFPDPSVDLGELFSRYASAGGDEVASTGEDREARMAAMQERAQELMEQGGGMADPETAAELQALASGSVEASEAHAEATADHEESLWDHWVGYLEEVDQHLYPVRIIVHQTPHAWPEDARALVHRDEGGTRD